MKKPFLRVIAGLFILIAILLIYTSFKHHQKYKFRVSAEEMHAELVSSSHQIAPETAKKALQSDEYIFIDLSNPRAYERYHIEGSVNVPFEMVLDDQYKPFFLDDRKKVLISETGIRAEEIWTLLTKYGYGNLYVLEGGKAFWKNHVVNGDIFREPGTYEDEKPKYDFKKLTGKTDTARKEAKK